MKGVEQFWLWVGLSPPPSVWNPDNYGPHFPCRMLSWLGISFSPDLLRVTCTMELWKTCLLSRLWLQILLYFMPSQQLKGIIIYWIPFYPANATLPHMPSQQFVIHFTVIGHKCHSCDQTLIPWMMWWVIQLDWVHIRPDSHSKINSTGLRALHKTRFSFQERLCNSTAEGFT